jgi:hypothetical protein
MPYLGIGFHVIVAIYFAVHAVRTRQNIYWLLILFAFPMLGSVVYFFAIYLPNLRQSRGARSAARTITRLVDPDRAVREARSDFDRAPTVEHRMRLGAALLAAGNAGEALEHHQAAENGPFATDPALLLGLARAQFASVATRRLMSSCPACLLPTPEHANSPNRPCCMRVLWLRFMRRARARRSSRTSPAPATRHLAVFTPSGWLTKRTRRIASAQAACIRKSCTVPNIGRATPVNTTANGCSAHWQHWQPRRHIDEVVRMVRTSKRREALSERGRDIADCHFTDTVKPLETKSHAHALLWLG